jgi:hypothetical protein
VIGRGLAALAIVAGVAGCAARGRPATPGDLALLRAAPGLVASGQLGISGPRGRFRTDVLIGVARPDRIRIEIASATGPRFVLVAGSGRVTADYPGERARFTGPSDAATIGAVFGASISARDLAEVLLGGEAPDAAVAWRFDGGLPAGARVRLNTGERLDLSLASPELREATAGAFEARPDPRLEPVDAPTMARLLGLRR